MKVADDSHRYGAEGGKESYKEPAPCFYLTSRLGVSPCMQVHLNNRSRTQNAERCS